MILLLTGNLGQILNYIMQGKADKPNSYSNTNAQINITFDVNGILLTGSLSRIMHPTKFGQSIWAARAINALLKNKPRS